MADKRIDPDTAAASARELIERSVEERVAAVRVLVAATNDVDTADQAAKDARDAHSKAWNAALASGWSDKELRATGARAPGTIGAAPRARRSTRRATEETPAPAPEHGG
ncbi:hypothetical protein [Rathayibacter sp. AY1C1]|jgi:hypothetical protein|uniref:hypothetical protein n=1 Tax=Rathayibacter sp. AY1C1 TaxID=2080534 RepID=UPI0011AFD410|nr:hypothetical protein [Rathayibacter sp. AY1C1]